MFKNNIDTYLFNSRHKPNRVVEYLSTCPSSRAHVFVSQYRESDDYATLHDKPLDSMTTTEIYAYVLVRKATDSKCGLAEKLEDTMNSDEYHALSSSMQYNFSIMLLHLKMLESVNYSQRCVIRNRLVERLIKRKNDTFINLSGAQLELIHVVSYNGIINLSGSDLSGANLNHSKIANQDLRTCNLSDASLQYAKLYNVNLSQVSLKNANLYHATLSASNLMSTDLTHAVLNEACFNNVILSNAKLNGAKIDQLNVGSHSYLDGISILSISQYFEIEDNDLIIPMLSIELDTIFSVIHKHPYESQFRKAVARDIKTIIENASSDLDIQLELIDKVLDLSHPIFEHRSTLSKNMNIALNNTRDLFFASSSQDSSLPTSSQKILIHFRKEIIEQINNDLKEEPSSGFSIN